MIKLLITLEIFLYLLQITSAATTSNKNLVCYYEVESSHRYGFSNFTFKHLKKGAAHCTHLVYASAHLVPKTYDIRFPPQHQLVYEPKLLKKAYPQLKIYLSIGGDGDAKDNQDSLKYLHLLEEDNHRRGKFIERTMEILKLYEFDGVDLAFPLPRNKPKEESNMAAFLNDVNRMFAGDKRNEYRHFYSKFIAELKEACDIKHLDLTMTVLPNVNSSVYFDVAEIHRNFKFINLFAFDFNTPERNPSEADYSAPLYFNPQQNRLPYANVDFQVNYWLQNGCPSTKLNLGIATYGQAWKVTIESGINGQPIIENTKGRGTIGNSSISWPTICKYLVTRKQHQQPMREYTDRYGNYAFRPANYNNTGLWISYDGPKFAATKVRYAMQKSLGGMVVYDLSRDDFKGRCHKNDFPILRAIRETLDQTLKATKQQPILGISVIQPRTKSVPKGMKVISGAVRRKSNRQQSALEKLSNGLHLMQIFAPE
ncbi:chitinase-like protein Idgf1 [Musca vetustissima]|uniref:chitinase-like protein Idgf1 n=1 Tax=Musca vetustissima TaxID=27455 RepID=UPI002AB7A4D4|nr:chitinase-like protein Idgf1 [Musca vetustissima]